MRKQRVVAIVAMDQEFGIGKDDKIPWNSPSDLAYFRETTMGYPVIMGSATFKTLGRPLPGRINIVLSKKHTCVEGCLRAANPQHALDIAVIGQHDKVFIIGGEQIYRTFIQDLDIVDEVIISKINGRYNCTKKLWDFQTDVCFNFDSSTLKNDLKIEKYIRKLSNRTKFKKKNFLIDIDGTICEDIPNEQHEKFATAKAIEGCASAIKYLREMGHTVTFFTSRSKNHAQDTIKWLNENNFYYDNIIFDKPRHGNYIWIDNLNISSILVSNGGIPEFFSA